MSAIVLPPLTEWAKWHLSSILKATTQVDFDEAFDSFVAKDVTVILNGARISRDELKRQWQGEEFDEASATVTFSGAVEVPANKDEPVLAGFVGVFYTATIDEHIIVRDVPVERIITASLNVTIEQDKSLHRPTGPVKGFFDGRRVTKLNQVVVDNPVPIVLPQPPVA